MTTADNSYLTPPPATHRVFDRNFIESSVLELKFPTIIDFGHEMPADFRKALRKELPNYGKVTSASISGSGFAAGPLGFSLSSRKQGAASLTLNESMLNLQVGIYESFDKFISLSQQVYDAAKPLLDTDFFTRIGYRIINAIYVPERGRELHKWINADLLKPIQQNEVLGSLISNRFEIRGHVNNNANYIFKYGTPENAAEKFDSNNNLKFMLDFDYFSEDIDIAKAMDLVKQFHSNHFNFFWWTLGTEAKQFLEKS